MAFKEISKYIDVMAMGATFGLVLISFASILLLLNTVANYRSGKVRKSKMFGSMIWVIVIGAVTYCVGSIGAESRASNDRALVSNIQQKYDVDEVLLKNGDVITHPKDTDSQPVNIVVDDVTYLFYLTQDDDTWEPTLTNPPLNGGSSEVVNVSADDLLK